MVLDPLLWLVRDYAALLAGDQVHRLGCPRAVGAARFLRPGSRLVRHRAPTPCPSCRPRVDLLLS